MTHASHLNSLECKTCSYSNFINEQIRSVAGIGGDEVSLEALHYLLDSFLFYNTQEYVNYVENISWGSIFYR